MHGGSSLGHLLWGELASLGPGGLGWRTTCAHGQHPSSHWGSGWGRGAALTVKGDVFGSGGHVTEYWRPLSLMGTLRQPPLRSLLAS